MQIIRSASQRTRARAAIDGAIIVSAQKSVGGRALYILLYTGESSPRVYNSINSPFIYTTSKLGSKYRYTRAIYMPCCHARCQQNSFTCCRLQSARLKSIAITQPLALAVASINCIKRTLYALARAQRASPVNTIMVSLSLSAAV